MSSVLRLPSEFSYQHADDNGVLGLIKTVRNGLSSELFYQGILETFNFTLSDWARFLHISERTLQRYRVEKKNFEPLQSEKILELTMLFQYGISVFGDKDNFDTWLQSANIALGGVKPVELLDTNYGIALLKDELTRIEHGVLA